MIRRIVTLFLALTLTMAAAVTAQASVTFTLNPDSGIVAGDPGQTVGWGYTISNDSVYWLWINNSDFTTNKDATWGTYTDSSYNHTPVAPADGATPTVLTVPYSFADNTGAGSFAISPSTPVGDFAVGQILFTYDLYSADPSGGGLTPATSDSYSAAAAIQSASAVPEPSTYALLCISLGVVGFARKRLGKREW